MTLSVILLGFLQDNCCMAHYLIVLEKPLFIGLLVYILGCAFVSDIDTFIGLRFIQARQLCRYGSCYRNGSRFVSRKEIPKVLSLLMLVVGLSQC
jgi:DHA1 family bicyclomycin/chloramphenicol resistance-like MFS transporter